MSVSYLNDSYLDEARKALPGEDPAVPELERLANQRVLESAQIPGVDQGGYKQVDLRPDWYKTFLKKNEYESKGPPLPSTIGEAGTAALGAAQQGAQANANRFAQLPGAKAGDIMNMQQKANAAGLLGGVMGALVNKQSNDFDHQQARAVKDASALKKNAKVGTSTNELLGLLNYYKTGLRNEQLARRDVEKNAEKITNADPTTKESQDTAKTAVALGMLTPEQANSMSKEQMLAWRTAAMQKQGQEHHDTSFDRERDRLEAEKLGEEERSELRRVEQEQRAKQQRVQEHYIPGHRWANDTPPDPASATRARNFVMAENELVSAATEMKQIQERLGELAHQQGWRPEVLGPDVVGQYVDKYIGDRESKALLAKAQLLQQKMTTALRNEDNLGVLQQFEKQMEDAVNPTAGTIGAFLRGPAPWDALIQYQTEYGRDKKRSFGLFEEGDQTRPTGDALMRPAEEQVRRYARPEVRRAPGSAPASTVEAPVGAAAGAQPSGDSLGVAPVPPQPKFDAPGADEELNGMWVVQMPSGPTKPRKLTKAKYKQLQQAGIQVQQVK